MALGIISWDKQTIIKDGRVEPAYKVVASATYFVPTDEQKKLLKKRGLEVVDGRIRKVGA